MADVTIDATTVSNLGAFLAGGRHTVYTSHLVGYVFYVDATTDDLVYSKTTDAGATWGAVVTVVTSNGLPFAIWYDRWTPGDTGTKIHIWYYDYAAADLFYCNLATATDTLSSPVTIVNAASGGAQVEIVTVAGAKARGGNLLVVAEPGVNDGTTDVCYRSIDGGANWTSRNSDWFAGADGRPTNAQLFPGGDADNQDMWLLYWRESTNVLWFKVYDDSGDAWTETSISSSMTDIVRSTVATQMSGAVRHSDNHLIVAAWNARDSATGDLKVWDITNAGTITAKTDIHTDKDDIQAVSLTIDQTLGTIYAAYLGKGDGSEVIGTNLGVYYKSSTDGGSTWSSEVTVAETATLNLVTLSTDMGGSGATRFQPIWFDETNDDLITNVVNSVALGTAGGGGAPGNSGNAPGRGRGGNGGGGGNGNGGGGGGGGNGGGGPVGSPLHKVFVARRRRTR